MPKGQAGLPVSPITSAETRSGVRMDSPSESTEMGTSGPSAEASESHDMEDVVQEADYLKHDSFPAPVLPSKAEVEAHSVSHLPFRRWCSACVRGRGLRWVTA